MNNDAGWCGSGGPWITPELSMQKRRLDGDERRTGRSGSTRVLPQPKADQGLSTATSPCSPSRRRRATTRIPDIRGKAAAVREEIAAARRRFPPLPAGRGRRARAHRRT